MAKITHIVLHYTATYPDQNLTAADIDRMHKKRGWKGIGYHWYIRRDGTVEQGRPESQVGAHVAGQNRGKIGICCEGGIERATGPNVGVDNRTPEQIKAQIKLIRELLKRYPGAQVVGHRDLAATQCPGFDVRTWWARVRHAKLPEPTPDPADAPVRTPDVDEDEFHTVEKGETWFSIADEHDLIIHDLLAMNGAKATDILHIGRVLRVRKARDKRKTVPPSMTPPGGENASTGSGAAKKGIIATVIVALIAGAGALWSKWCEVVGLFCQ